MPADPFTASAFYYDSVRQQLYGAFNNTIVRFDPDKLTKNNLPPDFLLKALTSQGKYNLSSADKIELSYRQNNLVLNLASVNFEDAFQQRFAYRFVPNGNDPIATRTGRRSVHSEASSLVIFHPAITGSN
jgi:hypothetical protein